ncbi:hypothetical protein ABZ424_28275 [Streptomyces sp. NPDC005790]|uniref:hypothetical protein n=1 Tax=Streptomyces sp. NPDC005790 TaxID=3154777 RepID=UPI0033C0D7C5
MVEPGGIRLFLDRSTNGKRFAEAVKRLFPDTVAATEPGPWVHKLTAGGLNHTSADILVQRPAAARRRAQA